LGKHNHGEEAERVERSRPGNHSAAMPQTKQFHAKDANQMSDMLQLVVEIGINQAMVLPVTSHIESSQSWRQAEACRTLGLRLCVKIVAEKTRFSASVSQRLRAHHAELG